MALQIPASLKSGHDALQATLNRAAREPGRTGEAARRVAKILDGHMLREEKFALRPLGLLKALGQGEAPEGLDEAVRLVQGLKREMAQMLDEHRHIAELLRLLAREARAEGRPEYVALAADLLAHAQVEEEVLYPAALLIGEYANRLPVPD